MIDIAEADRLADMIANGTGRGWTDDAVKLLADEIRTWKDPGAAYAAADKIARTWTDDWRPTLGNIIEAYNEAAKDAAQKEAALTAETKAACDGTGWVTTSSVYEQVGGATVEYTQSIPCKRCNPYLREVFDDKPAWDKYLSGLSLADLNTLVAVVDRKLTGTTGMPPRCKPDVVHDPAAKIIPPREGYAAARRGYIEQCAEDGRAPNWKYFDEMMLGLLGADRQPVGAVVPTRPAGGPVVTVAGPDTAPWPTDADAPIDHTDDHDPVDALADAIAETKRRLAEDF